MRRTTAGSNTLPCLRGRPWQSVSVQALKSIANTNSRYGPGPADSEVVRLFCHGICHLWQHLYTNQTLLLGWRASVDPVVSPEYDVRCTRIRRSSNFL